MPYEVRAERAAPRALAAVHATTRLAADILRLLDKVWPVLREQGPRTGHNVVVYYPGSGGSFTVDVGGETFTDFSGQGEIRPISTPSGEVAVTAHDGEYSQMAPACGALERWCTDNGRRPAG